MKSYIDTEASVKKVINDSAMLVETSNGTSVQVNRVMPAAQDAKVGGKVLLRYSRQCPTTSVPLNPVAMRLLSSV